MTRTMTAFGLTLKFTDTDLTITAENTQVFQIALTDPRHPALPNLARKAHSTRSHYFGIERSLIASALEILADEPELTEYL